MGRIINHAIPNLINGVSQQPETLRLSSQGSSQLNGYSSVVEGLKKRPPTEFVKKIKSSPSRLKKTEAPEEFPPTLVAINILSASSKTS